MLVWMLETTNYASYGLLGIWSENEFVLLMSTSTAEITTCTRQARHSAGRAYLQKENWQEMELTSEMVGDTVLVSKLTRSKENSRVVLCKEYRCVDNNIRLTGVTALWPFRINYGTFLHLMAESSPVILQHQGQFKLIFEKTFLQLRCVGFQQGEDTLNSCGRWCQQNN